MRILDFLEKNSAAFSVLLGLIVALATAIYALLTAKLLSETRALRKVQTEPRIEVTLQPLDVLPHLKRLHIRNIGQGPAFDLVFTTRLIRGGSVGEDVIAEFDRTVFLTNGLAYLGPDHERVSGYTDMREHFEDKQAVLIFVNVTYQGMTGRKRSYTATIDLSELGGFYWIGTPPLQAMARAIEKIDEKLGSILNGSRLRADVYDASDRAAELRAREERLEELRAKKKTDHES